MPKLIPIQNDGLELVYEPHERAFSLLMPVGWTNQAHLQREHSLNRILASAISPDKHTLIYLGDPRLPNFQEPNPYLGSMSFSPMVQVQPFTPADRFFGDYVRQCFGRAPGFAIAEATACPEMTPAVATQRPGAVITTTTIAFRHIHNGTPMECRLFGATIGWNGMWVVEVATASTAGALDPLTPLVLRMLTSRTFDPRYVAAVQQRHEHIMAVGRQQNDFINQMTHLQTQAHQQRMHDIAAAGAANTQMHNDRMAQHDASFQSWSDRQVQSDAAQSHWIARQTVDDNMQQARINALREEHTVAGHDGSTYQVDSHHERYYVNKRDNTYIGTGATTEHADLRRTFGVNPDDFEEVKILR